VGVDDIAHQQRLSLSASYLVVTEDQDPLVEHPPVVPVLILGRELAAMEAAQLPVVTVFDPHAPLLAATALAVELGAFRGDEFAQEMDVASSGA